jgi:hypothetical protein
MNEESKLIELFKKYPGIAARIRRSFAYHYDQIQREIEAEVATINKDDAATIIDYTTEYMEESLELDLMEILNQMDLLRGCDDQYFDYNVDEVDMVLYGATLILEQEKYKPLIMEKFQYYKDNFNEEEHAEEIEYYLNFLEKPETLYTFTENTINFFKSLIK